MSKARQKGTSFENHVLEEYLRPIWPDADRSPLRGVKDAGDFLNINGWIIEAKNRKAWRLPEWIRQVYRQKQNVDPLAPWAIVFKGDKRTDLNEDYVVMPAAQWFRQMARLRYLEKLDS